MHLKQEVMQMVYDVYGPMSALRIDLIARDIPPNKYPKKFLDTCKNLVAKMFNDQAVNRKFGGLYKKIKK